MSDQENVNPAKKGSFALGFFGTIALYILLAVIYYYYAFYHHNPKDAEWELGITIVQMIYGFIFFIASFFVGAATRKKAYRRAGFILLGVIAGSLMLMGGCGVFNQ